jgi:two-component system, LytTR family, sensor kinase
MCFILLLLLNLAKTTCHKMMNKANLYWLIQVLCWLIVSILSIQYDEFFNLNQSTQVIYILIYFVLGIISSHIYKIVIEKFYTDDTTNVQLIMFIPIGGLSIGVLYTLLDFLLFSSFSSFPHNWVMIFFSNIWKVLPWFLFFHLYSFLSLSQDRKQKQTNVENMLKISKLESLKKQLNPHFLFNALNGIKALTIIDSVQARESIIQLSDLLRLSLNLGELHRATLIEELRLARNYLSLEKLRFDTRLIFEIKTQENIENVLIMPMTLNTLLENAVKHGISQLKHGGKIVVSAYIEKNNIILAVENTGVYDPRPPSDEGGIGLANLRKRLELQYGNHAQLKISNTKNGTVLAIIKMPY